jgi:S-DNA-T family DNA segregation ATPase FtsK/SpoIIIE
LRAVLEESPVLVDLARGARVAVAGAHAGAVVRSLVAQLAVTTGPADWSLLVVTSRPSAWSWAVELPHVHLTPSGQVGHDPAAIAAFVSALPVSQGAGASPGDTRHLLVVTDDVDEVAVRTSGVRRLLHLRPDAAVLVQVADGAPVPAMCTTVVHAATDGGLRVDRDEGDGDAHPLIVGDRPSGIGDDLVLAGRGRLVGIGARAATELASVLAPWTDPEAPVDEERRLPDDVALEGLLDPSGSVDRVGIAHRWRAAGADPRPDAPLGIAADGVVEIDLVRDGPHALVAGTTGSGKSELLRALVVSLAARVPPDRLAFVLVDFKGGATFDDLVGLPHVVGIVTDLEPRLAERVLRSLRAEVTAREHVLRAHGCSDLTAARAALGRPVLPRLVIVVDEFAALALEHPHLLHSLVDVARRGRSLGVHLVLATQRPSGVVSDEIRTNTDLRIALRLHEAAEAQDVVGDASPASIRRSAAGRAVVRLGPGELLGFQSARVVDVGRTVGEIVAAAADLAVDPPRRPWTDPLPTRLDELPDGLPDGGGCGGVLGLVDRPDEQRRDRLAWGPADGHVLVVGSRGSGVTTALASLALRRLGSDAELLVVDAAGDGRWDDAGEHPRCAGVVRLHEHERIERLLVRAATPPPSGGRIVVIDGLGALRRDLEAPSRASAHAAAEALLLATPPGVTLLLGADGASGLAPAVVARCARRWILHLHDPSEGAAFGVRASAMPPAIPGRMVDAADLCDAQLAPWPDGWRSRSVAWPAVHPVRVLPEEVAVRELTRSSFDGRSWWPVLGLDHASLTARPFEVPLGDHLLVVGPARSGRSEVVAQLRRCWSEARPDAAQVVLAPRRLPGRDLAAAVAEAVAEVGRELARGRAVLLVIDDADLLADTDGRLLALVGRRGDDLTVVAACRADAVRSSYGTWLGELRRCRRGIVASAGGDVDADLLGAVLPRHAPLPARPGLCWLVADGEAALVQVAIGR